MFCFKLDVTAVVHVGYTYIVGGLLLFNFYILVKTEYTHDRASTKQRAIEGLEKGRLGFRIWGKTQGRKPGFREQRCGGSELSEGEESDRVGVSVFVCMNYIYMYLDFDLAWLLKAGGGVDCFGCSRRESCVSRICVCIYNRMYMCMWMLESEWVMV